MSVFGVQHVAVYWVFVASEKRSVGSSGGTSGSAPVFRRMEATTGRPESSVALGDR